MCALQHGPLPSQLVWEQPLWVPQSAQDRQGWTVMETSMQPCPWVKEDIGAIPSAKL